MKNSMYKNVLYILLFALLFNIIAVKINMNNYFTVYAKDVSSTAKGMVVMDTKTKRVLYNKNEHSKLPMASTTKIITAIVAIENCDDLQKQVIIDKECVGIEGTSLYLKVGEVLTIEDLLYGLMLRSGNDAAIAIAKGVSGNVDDFVELMNAFCKKLGLKNTNLMNPHGLPDDNHYTSAYDLAVISSYALNNEKFANIVKTTQKTIYNIDNPSKKRVLNNKNKLLKNMNSSTGVKTGFTRRAGRCFVGSAKHDDLHLVCVLLNCVPMFEECEYLLKTAFNEYYNVKLISSDEVLGEISVIDGKVNNAKFAIKEDVVMPLKVDEIDRCEIIYDFPSCIVAPYDSSIPIGKFDIYVDNNLIFSGNIYIINNVDLCERNVYDGLLKDFIHAS